MATLKTRELLDRFYQSNDAAITHTLKTMVDKPLLFQYEETIQTDLVDMTDDQLLELIDKLLHAKQSKSPKQFLNMKSYDTVRNALYHLFEFAISIHPRNNPFLGPKFKRNQVRQYFASTKEPFTMAHVSELKKEFVYDYGEEQAGYLELILLLFYSGFKNYNEIINVEKNDIHWNTKSVSVDGRTIVLTDQCAKLLQRYINSAYVHGKYKLFYIVQWKNKIFPYMVLAANRDKFVDYDLSDLKYVLAQQYSYYILKPYKMKVSYQMMYYLGLYDRIVQSYGLQRANDIIYGHGSNVETDRIRIQTDNDLLNQSFTRIQDSLLPFVRPI